MKIYLITIITCVSIFCTAQTNLGKWRDYFSYFNILDIIETEQEFICATQNGLFIYNKSTQELQKISKATGLHGVSISATAYNYEYQYLFIAYENGAFDVVTPNGIEYFVDIPIDTDFQGDKAVNQIYTTGDKAVFSMDFGVVIFDIPNLEFDETTYFRIGSDFIVVNEAVILNNTVIASSENGVYTHEITDLIPNFNAWEQYYAGIPFHGAEIFNNQAILSSNNNIFTTSDAITFTNFASINGLVDINAGLNQLSFITPSQVYCYDASLTPQQSYNFNFPLNTGVCYNNTAYGGTQFNGLVNHATQEEIAPDGPYNNKAYRLTIYEDQLYVAPGGRRNNYNHPLNDRNGYYVFDGTQWQHTSYEDLQDIINIMELTLNPLATNEVFGASYFRGITEVTDGVFTQLYDETNSTLETISASNPQIRAVSAVFDEEGYLFTAQSFTDDSNELNIRTPEGNWINYPLFLEGAGTSHINLDEEGWLWIGGVRTGGKLQGINLNGTPSNTSDDEIFVLQSGEGTGNLPPDERVICTVLDNNNTLWIGTSQGIRIKRSPHRELPDGNLDTDYVVVVENGIPEELLKDVLVLDIEVDAANRKWIATRAGVFYVTPNGDTTLEFFDEDNSPIPIDEVTDIEIDPKTGIVYFLTPQGMVSYSGDYKEVSDEFGDILVYPNPVRPGFSGNIVIRGLADNAKVKIVDINGNLLFEGIARGGAIEWNQLNLQGNRVASGIYLALMLNDDNTISATAKFAVVR